MSEKRIEITGWLGDGITSLPAKLTGKLIKHLKLSSKLNLVVVEVKDTFRWFISTCAGLYDYARGFYRTETPASLTGKVVRRNKLTDRFVAVFKKALPIQGDYPRDGQYGRIYASDTDIELNTGGIMKHLTTDEEVSIYHIKVNFQAEQLLWEDITNAHLFSKI